MGFQSVLSDAVAHRASTVSLFFAPTEELIRNDVTAFDLDVSEKDFHRLLTRAAQHPGYAPSQRTFKEIREGDVVIEANADSLRASRRELVFCRRLPGTPLVAMAERRTDVPVTSFSCRAEGRTRRRVTACGLRVHQGARLIFEASRQETSGRVGHCVALEIDLSSLHESAQAVENTVHIVLLGGRPHGSFQRKKVS